MNDAAFESAFEGTDSHDPLCGQHCPGPGVGKCRGGDCTLCDEVDCQCDLIARVRADERDRAAREIADLITEARAEISSMSMKSLIVAWLRAAKRAITTSAVSSDPLPEGERP